MPSPSEASVSGQRRRIQRTVHGSKREAERALARLLVEVEGGRESEYARLRLGTYLTERYLEKAKTPLRPETWDRYQSLLRVHVIPEIGSIPLAKLRPLHVDRLITEPLDPVRLTHPLPTPDRITVQSPAPAGS